METNKKQSSEEWVTAWQIVSHGLMQGPTGKTLKSRYIVRRYMAQLASFTKRKNLKGQATNYVLMSDVDTWNDQIKKRISQFKTYATKPTEC